MHQDVYNEAFGGEGAPNWAVCTDGITPRPKLNVPNWSVNYTGRAWPRPTATFGTTTWSGTSRASSTRCGRRSPPRFRGNPWVIGYDPFNEPYGAGLGTRPDNPAFDAAARVLLYRPGPSGVESGRPAGRCPADDPEEGLIPRIEAADPTHLVAYEGNYGTDSGVPNHVGAMDYPRLVLNFHDYCFLHVPNGPEPAELRFHLRAPRTLRLHPARPGAGQRLHPEQPGGPGWLLTEFGATTDTADLARITSDADASLVGWIYWQWINYDDPTGSHSSALWPPRRPPLPN